MGCKGPEWNRIAPLPQFFGEQIRELRQPWRAMITANPQNPVVWPIAEVIKREKNRRPAFLSSGILLPERPRCFVCDRQQIRQAVLADLSDKDQRQVKCFLVHGSAAQLGRQARGNAMQTVSAALIRAQGKENRIFFAPVGLFHLSHSTLGNQFHPIGKDDHLRLELESIVPVFKCSECLVRFLILIVMA